MTYDNIVSGIFKNRMNRFIAEVEIEGQTEEVHVKNTGRCKELMIPGTQVFLQKSQNPLRKTGYSLISIYKGTRLINMDSMVPNQVVYEAILRNQIDEIGQVRSVKREVSFHTSRFDLYYETESARGFIEVKGVTLEENGVAMFPDAPTTRGKKHVSELALAQDQGFTNYIFFLIQMDAIDQFKPNTITDPEFCAALSFARDKGVQILLYNSFVTPTSIEIGNKCTFTRNYPADAFL